MFSCCQQCLGSGSAWYFTTWSGSGVFFFFRFPYFSVLFRRKDMVVSPCSIKRQKKIVDIRKFIVNNPQNSGSGSAWVRVRLAPWMRIRIEILGWIQIWIRMKRMRFRNTGCQPALSRPSLGQDFSFPVMFPRLPSDVVYQIIFVSFEGRKREGKTSTGLNQTAAFCGILVPGTYFYIYILVMTVAHNLVQKPYFPPSLGVGGGGQKSCID
jgi:hypothetical protein